jgi:isopenicillin N synthase-like dioxygenase
MLTRLLLPPHQIPIDLVYNPEASPHLAIPPGIQPSWSTITHFTEMSYTIASLILQRLSASLNLTGPADLRTHHLSTSSSTSTTVLQHYPLDNLATNTSAGHFAHTDAGSVSILFTSAWGLQAFDTEHDRWKFVAPRAHCAVVNIGDSLRFLAGLRLASCLHRVVPCGRWTAGSRYSCIFFLRPHKEAEFRDAEGRLWRADEWLNRKFGNYRLSHGEQNENTMATGRTNFKGLWREEVV